MFYGWCFNRSLSIYLQSHLPPHIYFSGLAFLCKKLIGLMELSEQITMFDKLVCSLPTPFCTFFFLSLSLALSLTLSLSLSLSLSVSLSNSLLCNVVFSNPFFYLSFNFIRFSLFLYQNLILVGWQRCVEINIRRT